MNHSIDQAPLTPDTASELNARLDGLRLTQAHLAFVGVLTVGLLFEFMELFVTTVAIAAMSEPGSSVRMAGGHPVGREGIQLMLMAFFLGGAAGAAVVGRVAARFGPVRTLTVVALSFGLLSLLAGALTDFTWFTIVRTATAFLLAGVPTLFYGLLADVLPASGRGRVVTVAAAIGTCGILLAPLSAWIFGHVEPFGLEGWRCTLILGGAGSIVTAWLLRRQAESPRWLAANGQLERARIIVSGLASGSEVRGWLASHQKRKPAAVQAEVRPVIQDQTVPAATEGWSHRTMARLVLFALLMLLSAMAIGGFNILNTAVMRERGYALQQSIQYTAITFTGMPLGVLLSALILDRLPRRTLYGAISFVQAAFAIGFAFAPSLPLVLICGFGWTLLSAAYANLLLLYTAEAFPPKVRFTASGVVYAISRLSAALVPLLMLPLLLDGGPMLLFAVLAAMLVTNGALVLTFGPRISSHGPTERR